MKSLLKIIALSLIGMLAMPLARAGGPWTQLRAEGYFKLSQWWLIADQHFTANGMIDPNATNGIFNTSLYAEYGLTDRFTSIVYMPFFSRAYNNNQISGTTGELITAGDAINSFGDTDVGIKYGITKPGASIAISASLILGLPLGKEIGGAENNLQTGDGEFNQILKIDVGKSFGKAYGAVYGGFNKRSNAYSDEIHYGVEGGINLLNKRLWLIGRVFGISSLKNGDANTSANAGSLFANNISYTSASIEAAYYLKKHLGISANYATAFRGELIFASPSYSVGVFFELKRP